MFLKNLKTLMQPGETIYLQSRTLGILDGVGNRIETWEDSQQLIGTINEMTTEMKNSEGVYDETGERVGVSMTGYFAPFEVDNLQDYRIKRVRANKTEYYDLIELQPNYYRKGKKSHVELRLRLIHGT